MLPVFAAKLDSLCWPRRHPVPHISATVQWLTSGVGTYTPAAGVRFIRVRMAGGVGGGGAVSTSPCVPGDTLFRGLDVHRRQWWRGLSVARQFLKDNNIDSIAKPNNPLGPRSRINFHSPTRKEFPPRRTGNATDVLCRGYI